jgi:hypothetical protein
MHYISCFFIHLRLLLLLLLDCPTLEAAVDVLVEIVWGAAAAAAAAAAANAWVHQALQVTHDT